MEYPFFKCPTPNGNQNQNFSEKLNYYELEPTLTAPSDSPEFVVKLIKQSLKIQEECMALLNLLVEYVESKSPLNETELNLISFGKKKRLFT